MTKQIREHLNNIGFYIGGRDGEHSEELFEKVVDEIEGSYKEGVLEEFIEDYIEKNYNY